MELQRASRKRAKIKMVLQGPSGSGKTMSALLLAFGLCPDWSKIAVIDTENRSAELYSHLGEYNVVNIRAPFNPEKYMQALALCERSGMAVVIIDSISHEWDGSGGILDEHSGMSGNSYTNWAKLTPRHNTFVEAILQIPAHIIGTVRSKQDYILSERNGKMVPEKVGLKGVAREGMDYEFTLVLNLDMKQNAQASKDRTNLFMGKPDFRITPDTGTAILQWCNSGASVVVGPAPVSLSGRINSCNSIQELLTLYRDQLPDVQELHAQEFTNRRMEILGDQPPITSTPKSTINGHTYHSEGQPL